MESEIITMSRSFRELFSMMDMVNLLGKSVGMPVGYDTINLLIREDNVGTLVLAETLLPQFTSPVNHYATKNIWFREDF